jgi:hypothetical protein
MHDRGDKCIDGKSEGKRVLRKPSPGQNDNIKIGLKGIVFENVKLVFLVQEKVQFTVSL